MTAVSQQGGLVRIFVKGAPEFILETCTKYMTGEQSTSYMTEEKKGEIVNQVIKHNFAPKALRTIMVAYKDISLQDFESLKQQHNNFETV